MGLQTVSEARRKVLEACEINIDNGVTKDIFLVRTSVAGLQSQEGSGFVTGLKTGDRVMLSHEFDHPDDKYSILIIDKEGQRQGFLSSDNSNAIIATLLDFGKEIYGIIADVPDHDSSESALYIDLYLHEYLNLAELDPLPERENVGSYAAIALKLSSDDIRESGNQKEISEEKKRISEIYVINVINGEETGHFHRNITAKMDQRACQQVFQELYNFIGFLPLVGHGLVDEKREVLKEAYRIYLGKIVPNQIIDLDEMVCSDYPEEEGFSVENYNWLLGDKINSMSSLERECQVVWRLFFDFRQLELEPWTIEPKETILEDAVSEGL